MFNIIAAEWKVRSTEVTWCILLKCCVCIRNTSAASWSVSAESFFKVSSIYVLRFLDRVCTVIVYVWSDNNMASYAAITEWSTGMRRKVRTENHCHCLTMTIYTSQTSSRNESTLTVRHRKQPATVPLSLMRQRLLISEDCSMVCQCNIVLRARHVFIPDLISGLDTSPSLKRQ